MSIKVNVHGGEAGIAVMGAEASDAHGDVSCLGVGGQFEGEVVFPFCRISNGFGAGGGVGVEGCLVYSVGDAFGGEDVCQESLLFFFELRGKQC